MYYYNFYIAKGVKFMSKRLSKLLQVLCLAVLVVAMLAIAAHPVYQVHAANNLVTQADIADAYARFRTAATSMNKPLSDWNYGHTYRVDVADYYQVYTDKTKSTAIIICDITFDNKTYTIKFNTATNYYPGLQTILDQLEYIQASWPECFILNGSTNTGTSETVEDTPDVPSIIFGIGIDDDGDGLYDRYTEPDGKTAYRPEDFNNELTFQMYVIEHLDIYANLVTISETGEVYWRETGDYIGITETGGGHGIDID